AKRATRCRHVRPRRRRNRRGPAQRGSPDRGLARSLGGRADGAGGGGNIADADGTRPRRSGEGGNARAPRRGRRPLQARSPRRGTPARRRSCTREWILSTMPRPALAIRVTPRIEAFLEMLVAERGAARNTIDSYKRDLADVESFLARRDRGIEAATTEDLREYLAALNANGATPSTAARRLSALRQFFRFLYAEGVRGDDPTTTIESPRRGRP